jgi:hypothetical protein
MSSELINKDPSEWGALEWGNFRYTEIMPIIGTIEDRAISFLRSGGRSRLMYGHLRDFMSIFPHLVNGTENFDTLGMFGWASILEKAPMLAKYVDFDYLYEAIIANVIIRQPCLFPVLHMYEVHLDQIDYRTIHGIHPHFTPIFNLLNNDA